MAEKICDNCMSRVPADAEKCPKCGIRFENTNPGGALPNGWVLGDRYTIGRYLEIDGEGVTYAAIDGNTLQRVTIKEFMPVTLAATRDETGSIVAKPGCEVLFKTTRLDFTELHSTLARMGLSEGLIQVLDVLEANNTAYAVLEKVEGPTLAEYLTKTGEPVEDNRALAILRPVMIGVDAMHSANLIHRGISPENIILESGGTAKLGGFATLALRQQGSELKPKLYAGYSAPEQYTAAEFEGRYTDIYALGAVLYRMLTDETPVPADERRMQDTLRPARTVDKNVPAFLSTAIARAMRMVPAERIQNISDLRLALSGEGGRSARGPLGLSKQQLIVGASALGAIVLLLLIILFITALGGDDQDTSSSTSISVTQGVTPSFVGRLYADVVNSDLFENYKFAEPEYEFSDRPEGEILRQSPEAGEMLEEGTEIKFWVSKGPEQVEMPDLVGKSREEAIAILDSMNIKYEEAPRGNAGEYEPGEVLETRPQAGEMVQMGTAEPVVTLYVAGEVTEIKLPDLTVYSRGDAIAKLNELGIKFDEEKVENDGTHRANMVASTDPPAGSTVNLANTTVKLRIYDNFYMPDLKTPYNNTNKLSELRTWLDNRSYYFTYNIEYVDTTDAGRANQIESVNYSLATNAVVDAGTPIVIRVYRYTEPPAASSAPPASSP